MGIFTGLANLATTTFPNHPGSWGGLPDFGITEAIAGKTSGGQTQDLSQAVLGGRTQAAPSSQNGLPSFSSTEQRPSGNSISIVGGNTGTNSNPGGGGDSRLTELSKADRNPAQESEYQRLLAEAQAGQQDINAEIENAFNAKMGFFNQMEGNLRNQFPGIQSDIESLFGENKTSLDTQKAANLRDIDTQVTGGEQRREDAVSAARRLYNDLIMGGQQRFGGASTAGEAYQALAGRELQRNRQQIENNYSSFMQQIEGAKTTLNERYTAGLQALEGQKTRALNDAKRRFEDALQEVNRMKAGAQEDKANMRLQALQDLRNQTFQINMAIAEMKANLDQQRTAGASEIDNALSAFSQQNQLASQAGEGFNQNTSTDISTGLNFGSQPSNYSGNQMAYTGIRNPDEEMFGSISPRRDEFSAYA